MEGDEYLEEDIEYQETHERNVYKKEVRDALVDDDEISPQEEAFMQGYDEAGDSEELESVDDESEETEEKKE